MAPAPCWIILLVALVMSQCISNARGAGESWIWCLEDADAKNICDQMVGYLRMLDANHTHSCIVGDGDEDCMKKIQQGQATFGLFDGGEILEASSEYQLKPIRTEASGSSGLYNRYYGIGVVKKSNCPKDLADLKGKRSCHTGYGRTSGWTLPITYMLDKKIVPLVTTGPQSNDIESVKSFFSKSCAANDDAGESICTACKTTTDCNEDDLYYDYEGAFRGVVEDACDIGFTKNVIPSQYSLNGANKQDDWNNLQPVSEYQIVCPDKYNGDSCTDVSNFAVCNFGTGPSHSIMVANTWSNSQLVDFNKLMDSANNDPDFSALFFEGKNRQGLIFSVDTTKTVAYNGTVPDLLGTLYNTTEKLDSYNEEKTSPSSMATTTQIISNRGVVVFVVAILSLYLNPT